MSIHEMNPGRVLDPAWLDSYKEQMKAIWWQLVQLNSNVFILQKLAEFPFDLFTAPGEPFWKLVYDGLFETSLNIVWRVGIDSHSDVLTLPKLRDGVRLRLRPEYRTEFESACRSLPSAQTTKGIRDRVSTIRKNYAAHFNREWNLKLTPQNIKERRVELSDLKKLSDELSGLFDVVSFGDEYMLTHPEYAENISPPPGSDPRTDVERVLDMLAESSALIDMPETEPDVWGEFHRGLSTESLTLFNEYRRKLGRSEA